MATTHPVPREASPIVEAEPAAVTFSTYPVSKLLQLWGRAQVTSDQMIGHLAQHIADLEQRVYRLEHPQPAALSSPPVAATRK